MLSVWVAGAAPPTVAANVKLVGTRLSVGGGVTVSDTATVCGELTASGDVNVSVAVRVPAVSPLMLTRALTDAGAPPLAALTVSHGWLLVAFQLSAPLPAFVTEIAWSAGFAPPAMAENVRLGGASVSTGAGVSVREMPTGWGEFVAPGAVIVTVAVRVPAVNPAGSTPTLIAAGPAPAVADSVTHG